MLNYSVKLIITNFGSTRYSFVTVSQDSNEKLRRF